MTVVDPPPTLSVVDEILAERTRQDKLAAANDGWQVQSDPATDTAYRLGVLGEEIGEVNKETLEMLVGEHNDVSRIRTELVQAAAVCLGWILAIDRGWRP